MTYTYRYPRPMVTVDIFLLRLNQDQLELLLIRRKNDPFKNRWALPGGFVEIDELLETAARRELSEETGIDNVPLRKLDAFGDPGRDPRGRTITIVFFGLIPAESTEEAKAGDDAAGAQWFALDNLPELAFDHDLIIDAGYDSFRSNFLQRFWFILLLDKEFSMQNVKELFLRISGTLVSEEVIRKILRQLPFVEAQDDHNFSRQISNEELLKMEDRKVSSIWQKILNMNKS